MPEISVCKNSFRKETIESQISSPWILYLLCFWGKKSWESINKFLAGCQKSPAQGKGFFSPQPASETIAAIESYRGANRDQVPGSYELDNEGGEESLTFRQPKDKRSLMDWRDIVKVIFFLSVIFFLFVEGPGFCQGMVQ
jgi:hypothetical protein